MYTYLTPVHAVSLVQHDPLRWHKACPDLHYHAIGSKGT